MVHAVLFYIATGARLMEAILGDTGALLTYPIEILLVVEGKESYQKRPSIPDPLPSTTVMTCALLIQEYYYYLLRLMPLVMQQPIVLGGRQSLHDKRGGLVVSTRRDPLGSPSPTMASEALHNENY